MNPANYKQTTLASLSFSEKNIKMLYLQIFFLFSATKQNVNKKKKIRIQLTTISTITWLSFIGKSLFSTINQNNIKCKKNKIYIFLSNQTESVEKTLGGGGGLDKSLRGSRP